MKDFKAKAKELVEKFLTYGFTKEISIKCAMTCVDEILETTKRYKPKLALVGSVDNSNRRQKKDFVYSEYWKEVKNHLNRMK